MMEFMDGVKKKETLGISQILEGDYTGKTVGDGRCSPYDP